MAHDSHDRCVALRDPALRYEPPRITHRITIRGGPPGDRTRDTLIKSQVLYH